MPKKLTKKQLLQIKKRKKIIQLRRKKQKQIQKQRQLQHQKQIQRKKQLQRKRQIQRKKQLQRQRQIRNQQIKNKGKNNCNKYYNQCQCNFRREDEFEEEYYENNYNHCHHNSNNCHCGINLPPDDVCVPSRNYQFYQLPNAPIYDIPGGGFGSGLGHDMRTPYISPHAGMDMFTGTLEAPMAPNPMFLSYPTF